ncbi:uncharacterized protein LOC141812773 [Curcuma longa]|uniref:uncharacterized protein LOC141812773 n=1 Tax=Curcuma longa TaxID=136217 RepID=UPI003D9F2629
MATSSMQIGMDSNDWLKSIMMSQEDKVIAADYSLSSDELISCLTPMPTTERRLRPPPQEQQALKCPRCDSMNTKFCYYNNYSLSQPRYFCKTCRRYWTKGGSLRNVPVGGGCRRNKRRPASATILVAAPVRHQLPPAVPLGGLKPVQLPNCLMNESSLNIMDCSYNSGGLNLVMNHAKHETGDMNMLGLCMDRSRAALMVEPCQKLKFLLEDERWDHEVKSGDGSWNNVLSIGWQESVGYSDDHGSFSSSLGRI